MGRAASERNEVDLRKAGDQLCGPTAKIAPYKPGLDQFPAYVERGDDLPQAGQAGRLGLPLFSASSSVSSFP
jgi:hypothetical protein